MVRLLHQIVEFELQVFVPVSRDIYDRVTFLKHGAAFEFGLEFGHLLFRFLNSFLRSRMLRVI